MRVQKDTEKYLRKLGLKSAFEVSRINNLISRDYQKNAAIEKGGIIVKNVGTLSDIEPRLTFGIPLKSATSSFSSVDIKKTWKLPRQETSYAVASYNLKYPYTVNAFHFFHFGVQKIRCEANNFFKKNINLMSKFRKHDANTWKNSTSDLEYGKTPLSLRLEKENTDLNNLQISGVARPPIYGYNDLPFVRITTPASNESDLYAQFVKRSRDLDQVKFTDYSERKSIGYIKLDLDPLSLTGFNTYLRGKSGIGTGINALSKNNKRRQYRSWVPSMGSGLTYLDIQLSNQMSGINLLDPVTCPSGFYIPFPNTVSANRAYAVKCDTKISFIGNNEENLKIKGLLVISTGNRYNGTSKICYVSPHKINPILANTIVDYYVPETFSIEQSGNANLKNRFKSTSSVLQVRALEVTSEFNDFKERFNDISGDFTNINPDFEAIGKNGLVNTNLYSYVDNITSGQRTISRYYSPFSGSHLKQVTPLSKTPFYKFYNSLYTGAKTLNTGTWDGIIKSGDFVTVELITTSFDKEVGINLDAALIYKNYGLADDLDQEILRAFEPINFLTLFGKTKKNKDGTFSYNSYVTDADPSAAELYAKIEANKRINKLLSRTFRLKIPSVVILNRNFRKLHKLNNIVKERLLLQIGVPNITEDPLYENVAIQKMPSIYKKETIIYG